MFLLHQFETAFRAVRQEAGANLAGVLADLGVFVVGVADRELGLVEDAQSTVFSPRRS
jgi:hypothetical protein